MCKIIGALVGSGIALKIALVFPEIGLWGFALGFGMTGFGFLIGAAIDAQRACE